MKKILAMVLSLALVATMAITGSIAYLQDSDEAVNVMTLGNVYIDQHEYQRAEGVKHDAGDPGAANGYAYCRPYAPTEFVGCNFAEGYKMDPRAAVTFENCTLNGVALTADNLATLVTANTANATVK